MRVCKCVCVCVCVCVSVCLCEWVGVSVCLCEWVGVAPVAVCFCFVFGCKLKTENYRNTPDCTMNTRLVQQLLILAGGQAMLYFTIRWLLRSMDPNADRRDKAAKLVGAAF